jgi:hypothetical protein
MIQIQEFLFEPKEALVQNENGVYNNELIFFMKKGQEHYKEQF